MEAGALMQQPTQPRFKIRYKGIDITEDFAPLITSCTYTDKVHGEADDVAITVQDKDGLFRGDWFPEHGDIVELWIGYVGMELVPCGLFEVDEPTATLGRGGDTFSFKAVSAPVKKSLRTKKTKAYESQSLRQIAEKIAAEHGLTIVGTPPDVVFERQTQRRERDLEFLSRLASEYGAYFTVKGDQLVFAMRDEVHDRDAVFVFRHNTDDYISADLKYAAAKTSKKAKVSYFDGNKKKLIEAEVEDDEVTTGDTLRVDERVENEDQARRRAKSELGAKNRKAWSGSITCVGNPLLMAGQIFRLNEGFGRWSERKYVIKSSRHSLTRTAYTTTIDFEQAKG